MSNPKPKYHYTSLSKIAKMYKLEHASHVLGTDKGTRHTYFDMVYEPILKNMIETKLKLCEDPTKVDEHGQINILELGYCSGASLFLWQKYFETFHLQNKEKLPTQLRVNIYGIDNMPLLRPEFVSSSVNYMTRNAYHHDIFNTVKNEFDLIIEDGPHTLETQAFAAIEWARQLKPNGMLVIEDIFPATNSALLEQVLRIHNPSYNYTLVDLTYLKNYTVPDDIVALIQKA